jgi:uncharacterized protein DUF5682
VVALTELRGELDTFLASLHSDRVLYFPIRHHSPACAWHLRRVLTEARPAAVLVEGPEEMMKFVPAMLDARTRAPFALYSTYTSRAAIGPTDAPRRFGSYFPLCNYSPELVAVRTANEIGARIRLIDLSYGEQIEAMQRVEEGDESRRSLFDERHLRRSGYVRALVRRAGCRDMNELWDHMFETGFAEKTSAEFMTEVAAYCWMARRDTPKEELDEDGTVTREAAMATAVREELENVGPTLSRTGPAGEPALRPIVVVTGGFHTAVLPSLVSSKALLRKRPKVNAADAQTTMIRYSFDQLDALNGYASGMPSPHYYDRFWSLFADSGDEAYAQTATELIVEIGRLTREESMPNALSPADEIAALQQAIALSRFRSHAGPNREDVLDAMRSCFVKGGMDSEGVALMAVVHRVIAGNAIGDIPPGLGVPPIVDDFRRRAGKLRIRLDVVEEKELSLDIYRSRSHRATSRLLHTLRFLGVPFAILEGGPDFVHGRSLERVQEIWRYRWSPLTEAKLIEMSMYGSSLAEAGASFLRKHATDLESQGQGRSARTTVELLIEALRMGLHDEAPAFVPLIDSAIAGDASVPSLTDALTSLLLLWESREPLEAHQLTSVTMLAGAAFQRAAYLVPQLAHCSDEQVNESLGALLALAEIATTPPSSDIDPNLLFDALERLRTSSPVQAVLAGAAAGMLFGAQRIDEATLLAQVRAFLTVTSVSPAQGAGFVRGLLRGRREAAWNMTPLLETIDQAFDAWTHQDFTHALPELRLAFADLTPRETEKVSNAVAEIRGVAEVQPIDDVSPQEVLLAATIEDRVAEVLRHDGLGHWLEESGS